MARKTDRDIPKAPINRSNLMRGMRLFRYISTTDRWLFALGTLFLLLTAATALLFPRLTGKLVDAAMPGSNQASTLAQLKEVAVWFVYLFLAQAVFSFLRISLYVRVTENMVFNLRKDLFHHLLLQPMSFFTQNRGGDLMSRFSADISQIQDTFTTHIAMFLRQLLIIVGGVVMLFFTSMKLAQLMLLSIPVVVVISLFFGRYIRRISKDVQDMTGQNNVIVDEVITGIMNVKSFTNEVFEKRRFGQSAGHIRKESIYRGMLRGAFSSFIIVCLFGAMTWLIYMGLQLVQSGDMRIGDMIQFMFVTGFVGGSIGGLAEQYVQIQRTLGAVERVFDVIDREGEPLKFSEKPISTRYQGHLQVQNLSFSYPNRDVPVLQDVSFEAKSGEMLAIVGPSGSGKSTLASILLGLYRPTGGQLLIDGVPASTLDLHELRSNMALVPQEVILFGGSIYDNIRYGRPSAEKEEILRAAEQAHAHSFISSFPQGYETVVGDRGIRLSGGQRQRVAIARAILKDPSILVLDEATSSLDSESERLVQDALNTLMKGRTSVVIAHRLSTIRKADRIIVLDQGRVVESGSHESLMANPDGLYHRMCTLQMQSGMYELE
ncbi:MAG: ABC transporter ATP-binding protein/permease [Bacteroidetes bacterium]|nr:ABC transporter ATP-binding protein/permease [Bacteroidota bacterium]